MTDRVDVDRYLPRDFVSAREMRDRVADIRDEEALLRAKANHPARGVSRECLVCGVLLWVLGGDERDVTCESCRRGWR